MNLDDLIDSIPSEEVGISEEELMKRTQAIVNVECGRFLIIKHIQQGSRKRTLTFIEGGDDPNEAVKLLNTLKSKARRGISYILISDQGTFI